MFIPIHSSNCNPGLRRSWPYSVAVPEYPGSWCSHCSCVPQPKVSVCLSVHQVPYSISQTQREIALALVPSPHFRHKYTQWPESRSVRAPLSGSLGSVNLALKTLNFRMVQHNKVGICTQCGVTIFQIYFSYYGCFAFTYICASHRGLDVKRWLDAEGSFLTKG